MSADWAVPSCAIGCTAVAVMLVENVPACADHAEAAFWAAFQDAEAGEVVAVLRLS